MKAWRDELLRMNKFLSIEDWVQASVRDGVDLQGIDIPNYLAIHVAALRVQMIRGVNLTKNRAVLMPAEDGPYRYLHNVHWQSEEAIKNLWQGRSVHDNFTSVPLIKLRGYERQHLETLAKGSSLDECIARLQAAVLNGSK